MDSSWTSLDQHELLAELDRIERDIARTRTFEHYVDVTGETRVQVSPELLVLAEREHLIVAELRRRHRVSLPAA